jgi:hypothetical protein
MSFPCQNRGVCHGLGGYFETVLYGDIELSTNPVTMDAKSAGMISWFPIYFPLKVKLPPPPPRFYPLLLSKRNKSMGKYKTLNTTTAID